MVRLYSILSFVLLCVSMDALAAAIDVTVQPPEVIANESFRLIFKADGEVDAEPDFAAIEQRLEILGRNRQTSIQWINGRNSRSTTWILDVLSATAGKLEIPSIPFGQDKSDALVLDIAAAKATQDDVSSPGLLLEIEVDQSAPYVQQQIILTARLLRRQVELNDANLTDPSTDGDAIIKRLGTDSTYQTNRDNRRYEVFERRYALFPQSSGPLVIEPLVLTTQIVRSTRSVFDPFRQSVKTRRVVSNAITIEVKPIPTTFTGKTWLPAKRLSLRDDWVPNGAETKLGEPLTRTVFLWADGLNAGQLPEIPVAAPDALKSYPDQAQTSEQDSKDGISALRQRKFAFIPSAAGQISFPTTEIAWWNTVTDKMEVARLPARSFDVLGGAANQSVQPAPPIAPQTPTPIASPDISNAPPDIAERDSASSNQLWRNLTILVLLAWLLTAFAWWRYSRRSVPAVDGTKRSAIPEATAANITRFRRDVLGACKAHDAAAAKRALLDWGNVVFAPRSIATLGQLSALLSPPLANEIRRLDALLYGRGRIQEWDQFALAEALEHTEIEPLSSSDCEIQKTKLPQLFRLSS